MATDSVSATAWTPPPSPKSLKSAGTPEPKKEAERFGSNSKPYDGNPSSPPPPTLLSAVPSPASTSDLDITNTTTTVPKSILVPKCHPLELQLTKEVDDFFVQHWPFPNDKAVRKFRAAGFSRATCCYFPFASNERIGFACRLLTLLFLIDDYLEDLSFEAGEAYNATLMPLFAGTAQPDRAIPAQWIGYDLWAEMRACDEFLAQEMLEPVFEFMRAQTDPERKRIEGQGLGAYLRYRERDVGLHLLIGLMIFTAGLALKPDDLSKGIVRELNQVCAKHISVVNDVFSWEKELKKSQECEEEGALLCSSVKVTMDEGGLDVDGAKSCLWSMVRQWERSYLKLLKIIEEDPGVTDGLRAYSRGIGLQMSGNELWSCTTERYQ